MAAPSNVTSVLSPIQGVLKAPTSPMLATTHTDSGPLLLPQIEPPRGVMQVAHPDSPSLPPPVAAGVRDCLPHELLLTLRRQQHSNPSELPQQEVTHLPPVRGPQVGMNNMYITGSWINEQGPYFKKSEKRSLFD